MTNAQELIMIHVGAVVPQLIRELSAQGGVQDWQLERIQGHTHHKNEALQYYVKGESGRSIHELCEVLAVLAFAPGGVHFMGEHFEGLPSLEASSVAQVQQALAGVMEGSITI
jgi:hypothetical protein